MKTIPGGHKTLKFMKNESTNTVLSTLHKTEEMRTKNSIELTVSKW